MPDNKKHHYVPRFYLKRFSTEGNCINLWNIPNSKKIISSNLKNQCYKNYFYGKNLTIENALAKIEEKTAVIFRSIEQYGHPPPENSYDYFALTLYVIIQYARTLYSTNSMEEMHDRLIKHLLAPKLKAEGIENNDFNIGIVNAPQLLVGTATQLHPLMLDLKCKLLSNETCVDFVTSDSPVVFYNQLFNFRKSGSNTGISSKGLKIFFPISPKKVLLFYDSEAYSVGSRLKNVIKVSSTRDVFEINTLQMCSANENVYFKDRNTNILALNRKAKPFRRQVMTTTKIIPIEETEATKREFVVSSHEDIRTNLALSFLKLTRNTKKWRKSFQKLTEQPAIVVRDEELCEDHRQFLEKVDDHEYEPADFLKFLRDKHDRHS